MRKKLCNQCGRHRSANNFHKNASAKDGLHCMCKDCRKELETRLRREKKTGTYESKCRKPRLSDDEREDRKDKAREYQKQYRQDNWEKLKKQKREYEKAVRLEGIKEYGGKCSCCGEDTMEFLTLEHINGRGDEPKKITGYRAWAQLKRLGWPKQDYTVLCFNCNCAKGIYGICPHQIK